MILRRPYAFLIKYFKLIHSIMFIGMLYVTLKNISLSGFFSNYIANNQQLNLFDNTTSSYVTPLLIIIIVSIIILSGTVLYLMKYKNKPITLYIVCLVVYTITFFLFIYASNFIYNAQFSVPDLRFTKILRDVYFSLIFVHISTLVFTFIRMTGFDIKKFDFQKDIMDFDLSAQDREEFEFELNIDTEDLLAKIRKRYRIAKYYYKENKLIFISFFTIVGIILFSIIIDVLINTEWTYKEGKPFTTSAYKIEVMNSYKTFSNSRGNTISDNKYYVIVKLKYTNIFGRDINKINLENIKLKADDFYMVEPTILLNEKFPEFGEIYYNQSLENNETRIFTFVFELDKKYYNNKLQLKYLYDITYKDKEVNYKYRTVNLKPITYDKTKNIVEKKLNEEIDFNDSILKNTKLTVKNVKIGQNFMYKANYCIDTKCLSKYDKIEPSYSSKYELSVMRIDYSLTFDRDSLGKNYKDNKFFQNYGNIRFVIGGKEYNHQIELKDISPFPTEGYAFVEVRSRINQAEKIYLDLIIRDKIYTYIIK